MSNAQSVTTHNHIPMFATLIRRSNLRGVIGFLNLIVCCANGGTSESDWETVLADRTAVERVYYLHRVGTKPPFEELMPRLMIEKLLRADMRKEGVLSSTYRVSVTAAMLKAEVQRINTTTRAPDVLAELKAALGNDTNRFTRTVAKPIVVERLLRARFENDDSLQLVQRHEVEKAREELLAAKTRQPTIDSLAALLHSSRSNQVSEATWQFGPQPAAAKETDVDLTEVRKRFGSKAQIISSPHPGQGSGTLYFEDLQPDLQKVLLAQLRQPGDVSAVIEMPTAFALYLSREKTAEHLTMAVLVIPKRSYESWLESQPPN